MTGVADIERAEQHAVPISFRAPATLVREIEIAASDELLSVAAFVRRAVDRDIKQRKVAAGD